MVVKKKGALSRIRKYVYLLRECKMSDWEEKRREERYLNLRRREVGCGYGNILANQIK